MPCVMDMNIANAISFGEVTSLVAKVHIEDKAIEAKPRINGISLSGILLFFSPIPIKYSTGIRISNSDFMYF